MSVSKWARANIKTSVKLSTHSVLNVVHREAIMVCHTLAFDSHRLGAILPQNYNFLKLMVFSWSVIESFWAYDDPIISHLYFTTDWSLEMLDTRGPYVKSTKEEIQTSLSYGLVWGQCWRMKFKLWTMKFGNVMTMWVIMATKSYQKHCGKNYLLLYVLICRRS